MTEQEWLSGASLIRLWDFARDKVTDRKARLFACACCRRLWDLMTDARSRQAVEIAELAADGLATPGELRAGIAATDALLKGGDGDVWAVRAAAAALTRYGDGRLPPTDPSFVGVCARNARGGPAEEAAQVALLREVIGNPFRPAAVDPAWLGWNGGIVVSLAQAAYEVRLLPEGHLDPARLAVLADALEDAGCTDAEILGHLRGPGPHVRGCWVIDRLLGKE